MRLLLCIVVLIMIFLFAIIRNKIENKAFKKDTSNIGYVDLNQKFMSKLRKIDSVRILRLFSEVDSIIIRSLLVSAIINSYINFQT